MSWRSRRFFTLAELVKAFDITGISKSPAIFDLEKLKYFNSAYIKDLSAEDFLAAATPYTPGRDQESRH